MGEETKEIVKKDGVLYSYSRLDTYNTCPLRYKYKYIDKKYPKSSTLAMDMGSILHKGKELVDIAIIKNEKVSYNDIKDIIYNGYISNRTQEIKQFSKKVTKNIANKPSNKTKMRKIKKEKNIKGINELKKEYAFEYFKKCRHSGMTYDEKLKIYFDNLSVQDDEWKPLEVELKFKILFGKYNIGGFIDKVSINSKDELQVLDYKSSAKIYREEAVKTPMQMVIYNLACLDIYKKEPIENIYDFMLLDQKQSACSKGYLNRGIKKLNSVFEKIEENTKNGEFIPLPTPLCAWCPYSKTNKDTDEELKYLCSYHSLWTLNDKTFEVNRKYKPQDNKDSKKEEKGFWF